MDTLRGCIAISDIQINFQTGKITFTLLESTLEVVLIASCDWGQAKIIEDWVYKSSTTRPWITHLRPQHITHRICSCLLEIICHIFNACTKPNFFTVFLLEYHHKKLG